MCSDVAISVKNLTKTYRIFGHPGDRIKQALTLGKVNFHREFTALRDVSLEIKKGETVGLVGRNGSGKSTLLQLVCGILKPTSGSAQVNGRVSALLELGAGFNHEFTGRENVYFYGALIGFTQAEMDARFDDIVTFADIGDFIDQPVRTYSSGMYLRLAFSVAIHVAPDILVIDEALAVGDESFQSKCYAKLTGLRKQGVTILLVSHSPQLILQLCDRAILLEVGSVIAFGEPKAVVHRYHARVLNENLAVETRIEAKPYQEVNQATQFMSDGYDPSLLPGSTVGYQASGAEIINPRLLTLEGEPANLLRSDVEYFYEYDVQFLESANGVRFGMMIKTPTGYELGGLISDPADKGVSIKAGTLHRQSFRFRCPLLAGTYFLNAGVMAKTSDGQERYLHRLLDAAMFKVLPDPTTTGRGIVDFTTGKPAGR
jgi:lipopolysaccharide transport system ATP-binding protein